MKSRKLMMFLLAIVMLLVTACGPGEKKSIKSGEEGVDASKFAIETTNNAPAVKDAVLKVALVKDSPLVGIFYTNIGQGDGYDGDLISTFFNNQIFDTDENFEITDTGLSTLNVDIPNKKATIKIKDGVKWSDGQPLVADDIIYTFEVIANKDYTGVRFDDESLKVVGVKEYHEGKADHISGLKKIDDKTVEVSFTELGQGIYTIGNGLIGSVLPKHYLKDIPIKDLEKSEKVRSKVLTLGAYTIVSNVQGESLELKANPYYFKGKPKIEKVTVEVVNSNTIVSALKAGKYDLALRIPTDLYKTYSNLDNLELLGRQELYYSYMGFKVGHFDKAKGENIMDPNAKMADKNLRQALAYGLDVDQMTKAFYYGLRERATMSVPPAFKKYYSKDIKGYPYDPEKAKKLLDEAGYKDVDGDGLREDNKGNKLVFNFAFQGGNNYDQALADTFIKSWKEVGLDVKLLDNKLMGKKEWDQRVLGDDPEIDLFLGAGHHGSDPSRQELFGRQSQFNYFRYTSDKIDEAFKEQRSDEMFDDNKLKEAYNKFDDLITDELPFFGLSWDTEITYVNKRVKHFNVEDFTKGRLSVENLELTKEAPEK